MDSIFARLGLFDFFSMFVPGIITELVAVTLFPQMQEHISNIKPMQSSVVLIAVM